MTRKELLTASMLSRPHPQYGSLSYGKWILLEELRQEMVKANNDSGYVLTGIRWLICALGVDDPGVAAALASSDRISALRKEYDPILHISEIPKFNQWWDAQIEGRDMAMTVHKPDSKLGKSISEAEPIPAT